MRNENQDPIKAAIEAVEQLPVGEPFRETVAAADAAIAAADGTARRALFPRFVRASADTAATFSFWENSGRTRATYLDALLALHDVALDDPEVEVFLRSGLVLDRLVSTTSPDDVRAYQDAIAARLAGREAAADALLALNPMRARLAAAAAPHEAHHRAELDRAAAEARAREDAAAEASRLARAARIRDLVTALERVQHLSPSFTWVVNGLPSELSAGAVVNLLREDPSDKFLRVIERQAEPLLAFVQTSAQSEAAH